MKSHIYFSNFYESLLYFDCVSNYTQPEGKKSNAFKSTTVRPGGHRGRSILVYFSNFPPPEKNKGTVNGSGIERVIELHTHINLI